MPHRVSNISEYFPGLDLLASAVVLADIGQCILYVNPAAENLLGISISTLRGCNLSSLFDDSPAFSAALNHVINANWGHTGQNLALMHGSGQQIHFHCTVTPVETSPGSNYLLFELTPIDQQIKAMREERMLEQQLVNRDLMRNLAHEIKNPLGGIRGAAQLLEYELQRPEQSEYTQVIIREADRLKNLIDRLLSPHKPPQLAPLNIHDILEQVRSLLLAEYGEALSIIRDYDTSLPEITGDREQLLQAVLNIARNAAQALAGTCIAQITFKTRVARQVTLARIRRRLALNLQIIDNGPGIPESLREQIFSPLVSGRAGGSGLGLTIAQTYVQQHNGRLEFESEPGHTLFTVLLPLE